LTTLIHPGDLEPSQVDRSVYLTRRRTLRIDATLLLGIMFALLTVIPARLILPGTTDVGRPALVVCMVLFCWWLFSRINPRLTLTGTQPIRWALLIYWTSMFISYAAGFMRGLTGMEASSADRWMLGTVAMTGAILAIADGIANWERLRAFLRIMVWCAVFMAVVGLAEAALATPLSQYLVIPGLEEIRAAPPLQARGGGLRVPATTSHYIELSATLATVFPFAIHFARFAPTLKQRRKYLIATVLIGAGCAATISRTGLIAMGIALLFLMPLWGWRLRYNAMVLGAGVFAVLAAAKPSFATTLIDMFTGFSSDPSITSRTEDYELVGFYLSQRPWLGRGTGTWVVPQYIYLDNQWLSTALCNGIIGVAALATLFITGTVLAIIALKRVTDPEDKHLCTALISTQFMAIFVSFAFDSLWFDTYAIVVSVTIGLCAAVWRFTHPARRVRTSTPRYFAQ
jgi:polysaccharide biosynthesis protein PslJ